MDYGWIKIHRQLLNWEWYDDINVKVLFLHLILKANHKPKSYRGVNIEVGQVMTGLELLSIETKLSVRQIRTALNKLKSTSEVTIKTNSKGTIIQIVNYEKYQVSTSEVTGKRQTSDKQTTTNKNVNKEKNVYRSFDHLSISNDEVEKLKEKYSIEKINDCLDSIQNYKKNTSYKSLYLTCLKWLKKETSNKEQKIFEL